MYLSDADFFSFRLSGQKRDTTELPEAYEPNSDLTTELCFSIASPGISFYTSALKDNFDNQFFANLIYGSFSRNRIEYAVHIHGGDIHLKNTISYKGEIWDQDAGLKTLSLGFSMGYKILNHQKVIIKPLAGLTTSFVSYTYQQGNNQETQNSKTTLCPLIGCNMEYRFLFKNLWRDYDKQSKLYWSDRFWSLILQSGFIPAMYRNNIGIKGAFIYCTLGLGFHIGKYECTNPVKQTL